MTKADMRHKAHNYFMKPFRTFCIKCRADRKHYPMLSTFRDTPEGTVLDKLGYCEICGQYNEKQILPQPKKKKEEKHQDRPEAILA